MTKATPPSRSRRTSKKTKKRQTPEQQTIIVSRKPMLSSLPSWLGLVVALCINFISVGYTYATFEAKLERNKEEIMRNEREDRERSERFERTLSGINTSIANMGQLKTDVEVMKNSLASISDTLRRLERRFENSTPAPTFVAPTPPMP